MTISKADRSIAFQGALGAYSHLACHEAYPGLQVLPCETFEDTFAAVEKGRARLAMIPIENSLAGRVADIHHLLPESSLSIVAEHFHRVRHNLMAPPGASLETVKEVLSHPQALAQCRHFLRSHGLKPVARADTAGSAVEIAARGDLAEAAIASSLAAEINGLAILRAGIEDADHNTTRFVVLAREPALPPLDNGLVITSCVFVVKNVPAALFKALGGFATNGINVTKLESYIRDGSFSAAQFFMDFEGHPKQPACERALEELDFFCREMRLLGSYPAHPHRLSGG